MPGHKNTIFTFYTEKNHFYRAIITESPTDYLTEYQNHKETRKFDLSTYMVLFEITPEEYKQGRQKQRETTPKDVDYFYKEDREDFAKHPIIAINGA